jgi:Putative heavy-metal-binding
VSVDPGADPGADPGPGVGPDLGGGPTGEGEATDLPEAAGRRLSGGAWSSGLSVTDFAACLELGMEPVGLVQGYAVMQWSWYFAGGAYGMGGMGGMGGGWWRTGGRGQYVEEWRCPHGFVGTEHRVFGVNYEQTWLEDSWATGWGLARERMVEEADALGAHGIIGVVDDLRPLTGSSTVEFRMSGTAVVVPEAPAPATPFTTYLAGQKLTKLVEAGFVPVSVAATMASVSMIGYCITHYQMAGTTAGNWSGGMSGGLGGVAPINQVNRAQLAARHLARERVRRQLGTDLLHGVSLQQSEREIGEGDLTVECLLRGNRVRRFKDFDPLPEPTPVVRLG